LKLKILLFQSKIIREKENRKEEHTEENKKKETQSNE
jgi:hypothetical protein